MLNLSSKILALLMQEHRAIKRYNDDGKPCDEELLSHIARRDVYIEVLSLIDQFLDQIEWKYTGDIT